MKLSPLAFAKAAAVFMFLLALINSSVVIIIFREINLVQLLIPLCVSPVLAAVAGYAFASFYNYFTPYSQL